MSFNAYLRVTSKDDGDSHDDNAYTTRRGTRRKTGGATRLHGRAPRAPVDFGALDGVSPMRLISHIRKRFGSMDKHSFYQRKTVVKVEWWLSYCSEYPDLAWARLRVFSDGSADAAFDESKVYGFDDPKYAGYLLAEDEYMRFENMDEEDEADIGVKKSDISPPLWDDDERADYEYLGTY